MFLDCLFKYCSLPDLSDIRAEIRSDTYSKERVAVLRKLQRDVPCFPLFKHILYSGQCGNIV